MQALAAAVERPLHSRHIHRKTHASTCRRVRACAQDDYESGAIHHVVLGAGEGGPLQPDTTYFYSCGDPARGMSEELSFRTPPVTGPQSFPYRRALAFYPDVLFCRQTSQCSVQENR
jgi:hypothetical protein